MAVSSIRFRLICQLICVAWHPGISERHYKIRRITFWLRCRKKILRRLMPNSDLSETPTAKKRAWRWDWKKLFLTHSHSAVQSVKECWSPLGKDYNALKEYGGGLASVMPGTSLVEADFSLINWTRDPHLKSLTDFSLESILHCKQYRTLESLST